MRAARRRMPAGHRKAQSLLIEFHGAFNVVYPHPGVEKLFDSHEPQTSVTRFEIKSHPAP